MAGLRIAIQTRSLQQPLKQALHAAGSLGCDGVQIDAREELRPGELSDTGARQLRKMLDDRNLRVGSVAFATRRGFAEPQDLERRLTATVDAMRMASRLGARVLVFAVGDVPPGEGPARGTLVEALASLAGHASRIGVELAAHCPQAPPADVVALLSELPAGLMGVNLSPADTIRAGGSPREAVKALGPRVVHFYANDAARGLGGGAAIDVELGRGSADMPELLGALEEFDYRGWITIAPHSPKRPVEEASDAIAYLRSL